MKVKDDVASFWAMSKHVQASHHCGNRRGNANSKQTTISFDSEICSTDNVNIISSNITKHYNFIYELKGE